MKITFLGTGAGIPAKHRNVSSLALHLDNKHSSIWLFDCGEATQHKILYTPIKTRKIEKIFITHLHGDHIFGLPGLLGSRSFQGAETPLTIYGPPGIKEFIETSLRVSTTYLHYPLTIEEIKEGGVLFTNDDFTVSCAPLLHGITCYGYRVEQQDFLGPLLMEKVGEAGIPNGPHLQKLKRGETITLPDGRSFEGKDFIGPSKKGKIVTILGDTRYTEASIRLARDADLLVHESTFAVGDEALAFDYFHSTAVHAAEIAKAANVRKLILNHISSRYQKDAVDQLLEGAKAVFSHTFVAEDLASFSL
ncbi:ribonuclease Z [Evansella sp. AB-rgal1]|uniref:ribonuclease Z n=1 Tax=Evansella sp. AB-rgal1 TaxID=3242696 RepID=UPI00359CBD73